MAKEISDWIGKDYDFFTRSVPKILKAVDISEDRPNKDMDVQTYLLYWRVGIDMHMTIASIKGGERPAFDEFYIPNEELEKFNIQPGEPLTASSPMLKRIAVDFFGFKTCQEFIDLVLNLAPKA